MRTVRTTLTVVAMTAALAGLSACSSSSTPAAVPSAPSMSAAEKMTPSPSGSMAPSEAAAAPAAATGTMSAMDQSSDGKSVVVAAVDLKAGSNGGWIALHSDVNGKPGPVKYWVAVPAGASSNVKIPTPDGIASGAFWPMLHVDDHTVGTYEFPKVAGADLPAMATGAPVMMKIMVTVK